MNPHLAGTVTIFDGEAHRDKSGSMRDVLLERVEHDLGSKIVREIGFDQCVTVRITTESAWDMRLQATHYTYFAELRAVTEMTQVMVKRPDTWEEDLKEWLTTLWFRIKRRIRNKWQGWRLRWQNRKSSPQT